MAHLYGNRWKVVNTLGQGGQSVVFRASDTTGVITELCALKRIGNPKRSVRFQNEIEALRRVDHSNIITLLDYALGDEAYLVMPIAEGGDLSKRVPSFKGSLDSVIIVARQLCAALQCAHAAKIIHRDVKPQNILFRDAGNDIVLSDFGVCLIEDTERATVVGEIVGPRSFTAPELEVGGEQDVFPAADIYSLGKVIYYMITGGTILPRERLNEADFAGALPDGERHTLLRVLLSKMICPLEQRLTSVADVLKDLDRIRDWEQNAQLTLLSPAAREAASRLASQGLQQMAMRAGNDDARRTESDLLAAFTSSCADWLRVELEKVAAQIAVEGVVEVLLRSFEGPTPLALQFPGGGLRLVCGYEIGTRQLTKRFQRIDWLQIGMFKKVTIRVVDDSVIVPVQNQTLVMLPIYKAEPRHEFAQGNHDFSGFINAPGTAYSPRGPAFNASIPAFSKSFVGIGATYALEFRLSEWPGIVDKVRELISATIAVLLERAAFDSISIAP